MHCSVSWLMMLMSKALSPKEFMAGALEVAPGGVHILLKGKALNDVDMLAIGYRYSTKTTLLFLLPYLLVEYSNIIFKFFHESNVINKRNQSRQFDLALEKTWLTQDPFFHSSTTIVVMIVVNTWKLDDWHKKLNPPNSREDTKMSIQKFADALCYQFVTSTSLLASFLLLQWRLLAEILLPSQSSNSTQDTSNVTEISVECIENQPITIRSIEDNNGLLHH